MAYVSPYLLLKLRPLAVARREVTEHRQVKGRSVVVTTKRTVNRVAIPDPIGSRYVNCESCGTLYNSARNRICPACLTFNKV